MLRLDRGGAEFLRHVTAHLEMLDTSGVFSPALYGNTTRSWLNAGYGTFAELEIMERTLSSGMDAGEVEVLSEDPVWSAVLAVDRAAFDGFWGMSRLGLEEAYHTNKVAALLTVPDRSGYAIVGTQWGVSYLHRIAVHPDKAGSGIGSALMGAAINWGWMSGGRTMVLNVRRENHQALRLYERVGFARTGHTLQVLRHQTG